MKINKKIVVALSSLLVVSIIFSGFLSFIFFKNQSPEFYNHVELWCKNNSYTGRIFYYLKAGHNYENEDSSVAYDLIHQVESYYTATDLETVDISNIEIVLNYNYNPSLYEDIFFEYEFISANITGNKGWVFVWYEKAGGEALQYWKIKQNDNGQWYIYDYDFTV